jgi:hypothetical protein
MLNQDKIEDLVRRSPGITAVEIASDLFEGGADPQRLDSDCEWLVSQGRLERRGNGRPSDPYRYYVVLPSPPKPLRIGLTASGETKP